MRTKDGPRVAPALFAAAAMLFAVSTSGCANINVNTQRQWGTCAGIGAFVGALAGGAGGLAVAEWTRGSHHHQAEDKYAYAEGFGGGALGALIGAGVAHVTCDPELGANSNVTYYGNQSSTTTTTTAPAAP
jgi:hypothetical protein